MSDESATSAVRDLTDSKRRRRWRAVRKLRTLHTRDARDGLLKATGLGDLRVAEQATEGLATFDDAEVATVLRRLLHDFREEVALRAAMALALQGHDAGVNLLRLGLDDPDPAEARIAMKGLGALAPEGVAILKARLLESEYSGERDDAAAALKYGVPEGRVALREAFDIGHEQVRKEIRPYLEP